VYIHGGWKVQVYTSRTDAGRTRKKPNEGRKRKKTRAVPKELTTATNKRTTKKHSNGQPTTTINEKHQFQFPTRPKQQAKAPGGLLGREGFFGRFGRGIISLLEVSEGVAS